MTAPDPLLVVAAAHALAAAVATGVSALAWRRRRATQAAYGLVLAGVGLALWSVMDTASVLSAAFGIAENVLLVLMAWILPSSMLAVAGFVVTAHCVRYPDRPVTSRVVAALTLAPALAAAAAAARPDTIVRLGSPVYRPGEWGLHWQPGWVFRVATLFAFAATVVGLWLLIAASRHASPLQRRQARSILAGSLIPAAGDLVSLTAGRSIALPDLAGMATVVSLTIMGHALLRLGLLQTVPVARGMVLDRLMDAVLVIAPDGTLLDANTEATRLLQAVPAGSGGLVGHLPFPGSDGEHSITVEGGCEVLLDVRTEAIVDRRGHVLGRLVVARDVTELHRRREELARVNTQLRHQLEMIESLRAELAELAVRDELTGLYNRRYLVNALDRELLITEAESPPLSLALLDLDHFKSINDTYGHDIGDEVLRAVARCLLEHSRADDVIARVGGEEFVVLLPGRSSEAALAAVNRWREALSRIVVPSPFGTVRVTTSAGVASRTPELGTAQALFKAADLALYEAKAAGRNRALIARSPA